MLATPTTFTRARQIVLPAASLPKKQPERQRACVADYFPPQTLRKISVTITLTSWERPEVTGFINLAVRLTFPADVQLLGHLQAMFWARRRPERTNFISVHAQTTVAESQGSAKRNEDDKVPKEGSADCAEKKYFKALSRLEKKVQSSNRKYIEAFSKLEKKVQHHKKNENIVSGGADVGSSPDRRNGLMAVSSVQENNIEENPVTSGSPVNQPSCHEQDTHSETTGICLETGVLDCLDSSTKSINTLSIDRQYALSAQDSGSCTVIEGNIRGSERKSSERELCNDEKDVVKKEVFTDESSNDSNNQKVAGSVFPEERINSDLIKVFQCNFCSTYYLYYESYQEHKKKCLTCSKCDLTFPSIFELYKHVTSKAHKEYFSFLEVCKWTQSQLRLRISRNEVCKSDVMKLTLLASQEQLSALMTDSIIRKSLSLCDQKEENIGSCSLPCVSACTDSVTSALEKNESLSTSLSMIEKKTHSKNGEIGSPSHNRETRKPLEENNNEIVCMKKPKSSDCLGGPSDRNINTTTTRSVSNEPSNDDTQQNEQFSQMLPQKDKSDRKFKEKGNTYKKASPEKILNSEASKRKNVHIKSLQKIAKDCKSPQNRNHNRTADKPSDGSKAKNIYLKEQSFKIEQSNSASLQVNSRIITSKSPNKKVETSQHQVPIKQQSSNKNLHRKKSNSRALEKKISSKDLLQGTDGSSNSKLGKDSLRKTQEVVGGQKVAPTGSKICHLSESMTIINSSDKENNYSKTASPSSSQTGSQGSGNSKKKKSVVATGHTKCSLKRSHSFEESAPKAMKLLMKTIRVTSDFVVSCRKIDVVPAGCPGCSNKIDSTTAVYNTKTNHVSFWCRTCSWDIVFAEDA